MHDKIFLDAGIIKSIATFNTFIPYQTHTYLDYIGSTTDA